MIKPSCVACEEVVYKMKDAMASPERNQDYLIKSNTEFQPAGQFHTWAIHTRQYRRPQKWKFNSDPGQWVDMSEVEIFAS